MKIIRILIIIFGLFIIAEATCRIIMPSYVRIIDNNTGKRIWLSEVLESSQKGKRFKPNLDLTVYNAWMSYIPKLTLKTNSLGLRGPEIILNSSDNEYRILILGDSITWAGYLPQEETFVMRLENLLSKQDNNVRTVNAGIGDVGIEEEVSFLKEIYGKVKPKMVILAFYLNDSRPSFGFESEKKLSWAKFLQKSRSIDVIYNNIQVQMYLMRHNILGKGYRYRWLYLSKNPKWKSDKQYFKELVEEANLDWGAAWEESSWGIVERNIQELNKFSVENGVKFIVMCLPVSFQVYADFLDDIPQKRIRAIMEKGNIPFLDLLPKLRQDNKINLFYDHCHLNADGQNIVAQELSRFLITNKLLQNG